MQAQQAILTFSEGERSLGDRLLKIAVETDRVEGYSEPHAIAIARMAEKAGALMGLHGVDLTALKFAALAHDLGERAMKRNYLLRPSVLTWEETLDLWRHPILGEQAAGELRLSRQTQLLIRWHHEWWNGTGYPDGLAGEAIPLAARILRAVDTYFALISDRPHRQRYEKLEAEQFIADSAGIELDPMVVKVVLQILAEEQPQEPAIETPFDPAGSALSDAPFESEAESEAEEEGEDEGPSAPYADSRPDKIPSEAPRSDYDTSSLERHDLERHGLEQYPVERHGWPVEHSDAHARDEIAPGRAHADTRADAPSENFGGDPGATQGLESRGPIPRGQFEPLEPPRELEEGAEDSMSQHPKGWGPKL